MICYMATGPVLSYTNMLQSYCHTNAALLQTNERQIMLAWQLCLYFTRFFPHQQRFSRQTWVLRSRHSKTVFDHWTLIQQREACFLMLDTSRWHHRCCFYNDKELGIFQQQVLMGLWTNRSLTLWKTRLLTSWLNILRCKYYCSTKAI